MDLNVTAGASESEWWEPPGRQHGPMLVGSLAGRFAGGAGARASESAADKLEIPEAGSGLRPEQNPSFRSHGAQRHRSSRSREPRRLKCFRGSRPPPARRRRRGWPTALLAGGPAIVSPGAVRAPGPATTDSNDRDGSRAGSTARV